MTKSELITRLAELNPHLYLRDVERIVDTVFDEITQALVDGDRVELRGFGAFSVKHRDARVGRNPRTGEAVQVEADQVEADHQVEAVQASEEKVIDVTPQMNYSKMQVTGLRRLVTERKLASNPSKLRKQELISLLEK